MNDSLFEKLTLLQSLSLESFRAITQNLKLRHCPKGSLLFTEGAHDNNLYIVAQGILRASLTENGNDITFWFISEQEMFFSSWSFIARQKSPISLEATEEAIVIELNRDALEELCRSSLEIANWFRRLMENRIYENDEWWRNYTMPSAKERYKMLLKRDRNILQRIPLKHIASYLWITPQSLSRIRAQQKRSSSKE